MHQNVSRWLRGTIRKTTHQKVSDRCPPRACVMPSWLWCERKLSCHASFRPFAMHLLIRLLTAISIFHLSACGQSKSEDRTALSGQIEVVPANQPALIQSQPDGWKTEWISQRQGLAVTSETIYPERFKARGLLHVWSLQTGKVLRSIECPASVQVIAGDGESPVVAVAGGPYNKNLEDPPFVWLVNLLTGEIVHKLSAWPATSPGQPSPQPIPSIRSGALSPDKRAFLLRFYDFCVSYDLARPNLPPRTLPMEAWQGIARSSVPSNLPNWLLHAGTSDGKLTLNESTAGPGVWRNDTWEQILSLGGEGAAVAIWTPAPDGSVVVGIRPPPSKTHLLWDLKNLEVTEWNEPRLQPGCVPAFTEDGRILRFARLTDNGRVEFVSRDWRAGAERVDYTTDSVRQREIGMTYRGRRSQSVEFDAVFSDDARALAVKSGNETVILNWTDPPGLKPAKVNRTKLNGTELAGVTPDGSKVFYLAPVVEGAVEFAGYVWDVATSRGLMVTKVPEVHHIPHFGLQSYRAVGGEVLWYRVSGSSLGPYEFGMASRPESSGDWKIWPRDDLRLLRSAAFVRPTGSKENVLVGWFDAALRTYDSRSGRILSEISRADVTRSSDRRLVAPLGGRVFLALKGGGAQILDVGSDGSFKQVAELWSPTPGSWLALLPDGRYAVSPSSSPPIFFRSSGQLYPIEELDAERNQPDAVAEALGAPASVVAEFRAQREKRLARLGARKVTAAPIVRPSLRLKSPPPLLSDQPRLGIQADVRAEGAAIAAIDLYVNDVPVFGTKGMAFTCPAGSSQSLRVEIPLVPGSNKVQLAARDVTGANSFRELFLVHRSNSDVHPRRFVLAIGVADYDEENLKLTYASKDASDIAEALTRVKGRFKEPKTLVLTDKQARRAGILAAKNFLQQSQPEDEAIVFVSGHGVVNDKGDYAFCPADFHPQDLSNGVSFADLEGLFDGIPALARLLLVDSCHSGELSAEQIKEVEAKVSGSAAAKGIRIRVPRAVVGAQPTAPQSGASRAAREMFLDLRRTTGATVLSAAGGLEFAMEDADAKNGLFTHSMLAALASPNSDINQDGEVTASELVQTVSKIVEEETAGQQRPNARFVNLAVDFPIVSARGLYPPGTPEDVVRNFVEWSSGANDDFNRRVLSCFAPEIRYFGSSKPIAAVEAEERSYQARFRIRDNKITSLSTTKEDGAGIVTIRYGLQFNHGGDFELTEANRILAELATGKNNGWRDGLGWKVDKQGRQTHRLMYRSGTLNMTAGLRQFGNEWKMVSLQAIGGLTPEPASINPIDLAAKQQAFARAQESDRQLNASYSALRSRLNPGGKAQLKDLQMQWLKARAVQTGSNDLLALGMKADAAALVRFAGMTEARTAALREMLRSLP